MGGRGQADIAESQALYRSLRPIITYAFFALFAADLDPSLVRLLYRSPRFAFPAGSGSPWRERPAEYFH